MTMTESYLIEIKNEKTIDSQFRPNNFYVCFYFHPEKKKKNRVGGSDLTF